MTAKPKLSTKFFIIPSTELHEMSCETAQVYYRYLTAFGYKQAAADYRKRANQKSERQAKNWRVKMPKAIPFSNNQADAAVNCDDNAPEQCWAVMDMCNGNPETDDGTRYLIVVRTKAEADTYIKVAAQTTLGLIVGSRKGDLSKPFKLWQCAS